VRLEQAHKTNLDDSWNASNHNLNYLSQVITFQRCILGFIIRDINPQAIAQHREQGAGACKVLNPGNDLVAPLSFQLYPKPEFRGQQNRRDGKHSDAMIKYFRGLLDNTLDTTHCVAIYRGMWMFIKYKSDNKAYISDDQLDAMELYLYRGIKVPAEVLDGERIPQMCLCTGCQSWCRGDRRNDWLWEMQCLGKCYDALNGRLQWQMQRLFKIKLLHEDGPFVEYWLSLALTTIPENLGILDAVSKYVQPRKAPGAIAFQVFSVENIVGCAHLFPEKSTSSKTGDGRNERWIVNSHIDLVTWNDVYN